MCYINIIKGNQHRNLIIKEETAMMIPSVYKKSYFDDFFDDFFSPIERLQPGKGPERHGLSLMKTDIKENEKDYELAVDIPGCKKEDVKAQVKDGYLVISATSNSENEEKDEEGKFIRRERYSGTMSRSFYVGDSITEADVQAKFENGTLKLTIPKEEHKMPEEPKYIAIEG